MELDWVRRLETSCNELAEGLDEVDTARAVVVCTWSDATRRVGLVDRVEMGSGDCDRTGSVSAYENTIVNQ